MGFLDFFRKKKTGGDSSQLEKQAPDTSDNFVGPRRPEPVQNEDPNFVGPPERPSGGGGGSSGGGGSTTPQDTGIRVITEAERNAGAGSGTIPAVTVGGRPGTYQEDQAKLNFMRDTPVYTAPPGREQSRGEFEKTQQNIYFREDQYRAYGKLSQEFKQNPEKFKGKTGVTITTTPEGTQYSAGPEFFEERLGGATAEFMYGRAGADAKQRFKNLDYETQFKLRSTGTALAVTKGASDLTQGIKGIVIDGLGGGIAGPEGDKRRTDLKQRSKGPVALGLEGVPQTTADKLTTAGTKLLIVGPGITKGLAGTGGAFKGGFTARGGFKNPVRSTVAGGKDLIGFAGARAVDSAPFGFVQRTYGPKVTPKTDFKGFFKTGKSYTRFSGSDKTGAITRKTITPTKTGNLGRTEDTTPVTFVKKSGEFITGTRTGGTDFLTTSFKSGSGAVTNYGKGTATQVKGGTGGGVVVGRDVTYNFGGVKLSGYVNAPSGYGSVGYQRGRIIGGGSSVGLRVGDQKGFSFGRTQVKGIDLTKNIGSTGPKPTGTSSSNIVKAYTPSGTITKTPFSKTFQVTKAIAQTPPIQPTPAGPKPIITQGPTIAPLVTRTRTQTQSAFSGQGLYERTDTGGLITVYKGQAGSLLKPPKVEPITGFKYKNLPGVMGGGGGSRGRTITDVLPVLGTRTKIETVQKPIQVFKVEQGFKQKTEQTFNSQGFNFGYGSGYGRGGGGGGFTPVIIPPFMLPGGADFGSLGKGTPRPRASVTRYTPSFSAILFGIRGKAPKGRATGFRFRPITKGFKFIRRVKL